MVFKSQKKASTTSTFVESHLNFEVKNMIFKSQKKASTTSTFVESVLKFPPPDKIQTEFQFKKERNVLFFAFFVTFCRQKLEYWAEKQRVKVVKSMENHKFQKLDLWAETKKTYKFGKTNEKFCMLSRQKPKS